ncbi:MAG: hypothetical protein JNK15_23775 [Planctomycetes bacterium]|nr:hypothetical protein [Planctomycetota bacterium]
MRDDGSVPFVAPQSGVAPTAPAHLATKQYVDDEVAGVGGGSPSGSAGGDLGGTYPNPNVVRARGLRETAGPTTLEMGAVADGQYLKRVGSNIVGATVAGGPGVGAVIVSKDAAPVSEQPEINFIGDGVEIDVVDDATNNRADITLRVHSYFPSGW